MLFYEAFISNSDRHDCMKKAVLKGMAAAGIEKTNCPEKASFGIWWGTPQSHEIIAQKFKAMNKPFLIMDFPFWGRTSRFEIEKGYYKISLNGINPHDYLDVGFGGSDRANLTHCPIIRPCRKDGSYILLAGMGRKSKEVFGNNWDIEAVKILRQHTQRPIIYRAKPSDRILCPIEGAQFDDGKGDIRHHYDKCWAVVTHHGNSTLEGLCYGKPSFTKHGITRDMGLNDLSLIESPVYPDNREAFIEKLAWWQWHYEEIEQGKPFKHLMEKGLI